MWPGEAEAALFEALPPGFDSAKASPSGEFVAVYQRLGKEGVLLKNGRLYRELTRDPYHAGTYDYPIELFELEGREVIAHCPKSYCELVIEDPGSGKLLRAHRPTSTRGHDDDFFHSRLQASPSGNRIVSAGWVWHPLDLICVVDCRTLETVFTPRYDGLLYTGSLPDEITSAVWLDDSRLMIASSFEANFCDEPGDPHEFPDGSIGVLNVDPPSLESVQWVEEEVGALMAVGQTHAVGFYDYPKLFEISTGKVVERWTEISSGNQTSCISSRAVVPPIATDPRNRRFAVANGRKVDVVTDLRP